MKNMCLNRCIRVLVGVCIFTVIYINEVNATTPDSLSFVNFNRMLDEEAKIPLTEVHEDTNLEYLKKQIAHFKRTHRNDKRAYQFVRQARMDMDRDAKKQVYAFLNDASLPRTYADAIEGVYHYYNDMILRMIDEIGPKDFIRRYFAAYPKFSHVELLRDAKVREFIPVNAHFRYFRKCVHNRDVSWKGKVVDGDEYKSKYYLHHPIFPYGPVQEWIARNVKYPPLALKHNLQAKVFVSFVVDEDGSVIDVKVVKEKGTPLDVEAKRLISNMPKWIPAWNPLTKCYERIAYSFPINFVLN